MSNNKMWVVHHGTKQRMLLAKYYPSTGWYPTQGVEVLLGQFLEETADNDRNPMDGDTTFDVRYETSDDPARSLRDCVGYEVFLTAK